MIYWKTSLQLLLICFISGVLTAISKVSEVSISKSNLKPFASDTQRAQFTTVVDILSNDVQFSTFLRFVQRKGHIPYLNEHQQFTLLAPINSAFISIAEADVLSILENTSISRFIVDGHVIDTSEYELGVHIFFKDSVPHLINVTNNGLITIDSVEVVEKNLFPNFQDAVVQGVSSVPPMLPNLGEQLESLKYKGGNIKLDKMRHLLSLSGYDLSHRIINSTVIIPTDDCLSRNFDELELSYLMQHHNGVTGNWAEDKRFLVQKLILKGIYGGIIDPMNVTSLNHEEVKLSSFNNGRTHMVNGTATVLGNQLYETGIIHVVTDLRGLRNGINFTATKYLLGLNASGFVEEIYNKNLQHLIDDPNEKPTIFMPKNMNNETIDFTRNSLLYHFSNSKILLQQDFPDDSDIPIAAKMYKSLLCSSKRLGGECQRLKISKNKDGFFLNDIFRICDATPREIDGRLLYVIDEGLELPGGIVQSVSPLLHCSKSLELLRRAELLNLKPNSHGYTIFIPCFNYWDSWGINFEYLQRNLTALNIFIKNMVYEGLVYTDMPSGTVSLSNLAGHSVVAKLEENASPNERVIKLSNLDDAIKVKTSSDLIFNNGVVHALQSVSYPKLLTISTQNLLETTASGFVTLLEKFEDIQQLIHANNVSFLVPSDARLINEGITQNSTQLEDFIRLHTIPNAYTDSLLSCNGTIGTILNQQLLCLEVMPGNYVLKIQDGQDKEVRILNRGCTTDNKSCVFMIDRPLSLSWINKEKYHLQLPGLSFAIGLVLGILISFVLLACVVVVWNSKMPNFAVPLSDNNEEVTPLLQGDVTNIRTEGQNYQTNKSADVAGHDTGLISEANNKPHK
ncbi:HHL001Wp [Eremothecium sinecaudum]|uniref:HHL001Wp n=1 Tax=Eremothecium sinecaudum TaxID=45286 RepID=A0A0X8HWF0_9SACH|nr:HHL001Wp [Eremothecium sinecaudum]AMD22769.1 HHL001Wp [Eremothecium sinecaudum]